MSASVVRGELRLAARGPGGHQELRHALTPLLGWTLLSPFTHQLGGRTDILTALWAAALLLPVGYWLAAALRPARAGARTLLPPAAALAALAGALLVGLWALPIASGAPPTPWWQWAASGAGLLAGWALQAVATGRSGEPAAADP